MNAEEAGGVRGGPDDCVVAASGFVLFAAVLPAACLVGGWWRRRAGRGRAVSMVAVAIVGVMIGVPDAAVVRDEGREVKLVGPLQAKVGGEQLVHTELLGHVRLAGWCRAGSPPEL